MENDIGTRAILSPEEFQRYKDQLEIDPIGLMIVYSVLLERDSGINFADITHEISGEEEVDENELIDEINSIIKGHDIRTITEKQFLEYIPSEYRNIMEQFKEIYEASKDRNLKIMAIIEQEQVKHLTDKIEEIRNIHIQDVAKTISSLDLSRIPPEMYNDIRWLDKIDFQNTSANIDMNQWSYLSSYNGSFKGCNLISFNPSRYRSKSNNILEEKYSPTKDDLDIEQYLAVFNGYRTTEYFPKNLYYLFESESVKSNSEWLFDRLLKDEKVSTYSLVDAWGAIDSELQNKYKSIFNRILEQSTLDGKIDSYYIRRAVAETDPEILESYHKKLLELCTVDKSLDFDTYIASVWYLSPIEYKRAHFEEIVEQIKEQIFNDYNPIKYSRD